MASLKEVKTRINSVKSTRKITSAMKMVASAKLHKAQGAIENMLPYQKKLNKILTNFLSADLPIESPYVQEREVKRVAIVVFSSNTSLCGAFNANVIKMMMQTIGEFRTLGQDNILIFPVGKKVDEAAKRMGFKPQEVSPTLSDKPTYQEAAELAHRLMDLYVAGEVDRVEIIYHHFKSMGVQILLRETYLPINLTNIRYQLDPQIETVSFDKDKCEIILSNLLINALKHSPENTEITIISELLPEKDRVRISITDQGSGLKQVNTQKLFTRFYQGTGEQNGTGIGLSYSKILVELQGGSIGAYDNQEAGATFFIELPLRRESEEIICQPKAYLNELMSDDSHEQAPGNDDFDTTPYTVLVVDDNPDLTDFLKKSLGEYFKRVVIASDGAEALQLIRSHTPDIIVSDVMMPRMNGYELCKSIKEDITISHIPIILLTARDDQQSQLSGYKNGADIWKRSSRN